MILGQVAKHQCPMIMTFSEADAEFICESLGNALEHSYQIIDFFEFDQDYDPWDED